MVLSIKVKGLDSTKLFLQGKRKQVQIQANEGLVRASVFLQGEVKDSIAGRKAETKSVDTGRFLNSVGFQIKNLVGEVFSKLPYAPFLEFGAGRFKARRHFNNSANRSKLKIIQIIQQSINKI